MGFKKKSLENGACGGAFYHTFHVVQEGLMDCQEQGPKFLVLTLCQIK